MHFMKVIYVDTGGGTTSPLGIWFRLFANSGFGNF